MKILNIICAYQQNKFELDENNLVIGPIEKVSIEEFIPKFLDAQIKFGQYPKVCHIGIWEKIPLEEKKVEWKVEDLTDNFVFTGRGFAKKRRRDYFMAYANTPFFTPTINHGNE